MTRFAIDPATLVLLAESIDEIGDSHSLVAPNSIRSLALNILLSRVQRGELTESAALALHERMTELKIRVLGDRVSRRTAWRIAMEHDLETMELAEYVAVATLQADALISSNPALVAISTGHTPIATLSDLTER